MKKQKEMDSYEPVWTWYEKMFTMILEHLGIFMDKQIKSKYIKNQLDLF